MVYYGDGYAKNLGNWENWELSSVSKPIKDVSYYILITWSWPSSIKEYCRMYNVHVSNEILATHRS